MNEDRRQHDRRLEDQARRMREKIDRENVREAMFGLPPDPGGLRGGHSRDALHYLSGHLEAQFRAFDRVEGAARRARERARAAERRATRFWLDSPDPVFLMYVEDEKDDAE